MVQISSQLWNGLDMRIENNGRKILMCHDPPRHIEQARWVGWTEVKYMDDQGPRPMNKVGVFVKTVHDQSF